MGGKAKKEIKTSGEGGMKLAITAEILCGISIGFYILKIIFGIFEK